MPSATLTFSERFWANVDWAKVAASEPGCCWEWTGGQNGTGYGLNTHRGPGGSRRAHRIAYELLVGPIPESLQLDHLCRNRACVNPKHLEPVTQAENIKRGQGIQALNALKTHCPYGHPYDEVNTYRDPKGFRRCRRCKELHRATWRARHGRQP